MVFLLLAAISAFLALNMGVSGFSVSFAPSYGSRILSRSRAAFLYGVCVFAGGMLIGPRVVDTLANRISVEQISPLSGLLVLFSAGAAMFLSNALKIPQSTSFVVVASFLGAGLFYGNVIWETIATIVIVAVVFSALSFLVTFLVKRKIYPPCGANFRMHEYFHTHRNKLRNFVIFTDIYAAFGIGTNNVANVVAPIAGSADVNPLLLIAAAAPLFGLGAFISGDRVIKTVSSDIVPIGQISAAIVSFVTASFVIAASQMGLPTPYVQFTTFSVLAISCVKDGARGTLGKLVFRRIISIWIIVPLCTVALSLLMHAVFAGG